MEFELQEDAAAAIDNMVGLLCLWEIANRIR